MSECNYCVYTRLRKGAKKLKRLFKERIHKGWVEIFIDGKFVVSFMELSNKCACDED